MRRCRIHDPPCQCLKPPTTPHHATLASTQPSTVPHGPNLWALEIDSLDPTPDIRALTHKIAEKLPRDLALGLHTQLLLPLLVQVLDAALQALAQLVGGVFQRAADLGRYACGVGVSVV